MIRTRPAHRTRRRLALAFLTVAATVAAGLVVAGAADARTSPHDPYGHVDSVHQISTWNYRITGWAVDNDSDRPVVVDALIDGKRAAVEWARDSTPAVPARYGSHGDGHGFHLTVRVPAGRHRICVHAGNRGPGRWSRLNCHTVDHYNPPRGYVSRVRQISGGVEYYGAAWDPNTPHKPITVSLEVNGKGVGAPHVANRRAHGGHGFAVRRHPIAEGPTEICVIAHNVDWGHDRKVGCKSITLDYDPVGGILGLTQVPGGVQVDGWSTDPDEPDAAIDVTVSDGDKPLGTVTADGRGKKHDGHQFSATYRLASGSQTICLTGKNVGPGKDAQLDCQRITPNYDPVGAFEQLGRSSGDPNQLTVSGWALDRGTAAPITVSATVDGAPAPSTTADRSRPDIASKYPHYGADHGFAFTVPADAGEHTVCLTAVNVGAGKDVSLGCEIVIAVHPKPPSAPQQVGALAGYGGATVQWTAPADDGGAPPNGYVITSSPGNVTVKVDGDSTTATVLGLKAHRTYTFSVVAANVAGTSPAAVTAQVTTQSSPPPQTSPAPVSTSRYIRNISSGSARERRTMRTEGATDAYYNPSGHGYLILLDIGGQDSYDGGVVLSATTRLVSYATLVADLKAYVDGYASKQKPSAPVTIAIGTNNDMDVTHGAGGDWANKVVDPVASYVAAHYPGMTIAGANDIEPGFRGTYRQTRSWLNGYLAATDAPFVFNGSADGCSWTHPGRRCNNGWTMAGLYQLAGGVSPTRILNLPQIYNTTMPKQWKFISLTGVNRGRPRINFGGTLTEWTACDQAGGCGSISGHYAWQQLWNQLRSNAALRVSSLPYSTDLRIDR